MGSASVQRLVAELVGTTMFVMFVVGAFIASGDPLAGAIALILVNAVAVWIFGGHFNPWITLAVALRGTLDWMAAVGLIIAQLVGGVLGALGVWLVLGNMAVNASLGVTHVATGKNVVVAIIAEAIAVFVLCCVVFALANNSNLGVGIGMALAAGALLIAPVTGASINFARSFGPELVMQFAGASADWKSFGGLWVYLVSGAIGAAAAAFAYPLWHSSPAAKR